MVSNVTRGVQAGVEHFLHLISEEIGGPDSWGFLEEEIFVVSEEMLDPSIPNLFVSRLNIHVPTYALETWSATSGSGSPMQSPGT